MNSMFDLKNLHLPEFLILLFISITAVIFCDLLFFGIGAVILISFWYIDFGGVEKKNFFLSFVLVVFLMLTSSLFDPVRLIINCTNLFILFYFFYNKYQLKIYKYPRLPKILSVFMILVLFSMTLSSVFSVNIFSSLTDTLRQIAFFIIVYLFYSTIEFEKDIYFYLSAICLSGLILSLIIIYTFFSSDSLSYLLITTGFVKDTGYMDNPAVAGGILAVSIPISLSYIFSNTKWKKLVGVLCVFQIVGLLLTNSRAAIVAAVISSALILFLLRRKLFSYFFFSLLSAIIILVSLFPSVIEIATDFFRLTRVLENTRYYIWDIAFQIISEHYLIGIGPGQFLQNMYNNLPILLNSWEANQLNILYEQVGSFGILHNFILQLLTELGLPGLVISISLPALYLKFGFSALKKNKTKNTYPLIIGMVSTGIGLFVRSFYEATGLLSYGWISRDLPFWILLLSLMYFDGKILSSTESINQFGEKDIIE